MVSTPLPEVCAYKGLVEIADGPRAFEIAIERILQTGPQDRRHRARAMRSETWPEKVSLICRELEKTRVAKSA